MNSGDISLVTSDDGINAAGGADSSGFGDGFGMGASDGSIVISVKLIRYTLEH